MALPKRVLQFILITWPALVWGQSDCLLLRHQNTSNGVIILDQRNSYNNNGQITEEIKVHQSPYDGAYSTNRVFEYNEKGFLIKVTQYHNETFKSATFFRYDGRGRLSDERESTDPAGTNEIRSLTQEVNGAFEKAYFENNGQQSGKEVTTKDPSGKILRYELRGRNNELMQELVNTYNEAGKPLYQKRNDVVGNMIHETYSRYNARSEILADSTFLNGKMIGQTKFLYDNSGLVKRTRIDRNATTDYEISYRNNSGGFPLEETFWYRGTFSSRIERDYNAFNQLTEERTFNDQNQLANTKTWEYSCPN